MSTPALIGVGVGGWALLLVGFLYWFHGVKEQERAIPEAIYLSYLTTQESAVVVGQTWLAEQYARGEDFASVEVHYLDVEETPRMVVVYAQAPDRPGVALSR
jgi:hypothetical protein